MSLAQVHQTSVLSEFADADLGDKRLNKRLMLLAERLSARPAESFPKALDDAELEGAYRFFGNDEVTPAAILAPHFRQTAGRAAGLKRIIVAHDTTQFEFSGLAKRPGLGRLVQPSAQGFFGHLSLAMSADGERAPVGVLALETIFRHKKSIGKKNWTREQSLGESARWLRGVDAVEERVSGLGVETVHVMDREADQYALLAAMAEAKRFFVVRSFQDRRLTGEDEARLRATACAAKVTLCRDVILSSRPNRKGPMGKRHPARRHRTAKLSFSATTVDLKRTSDAKTSQSPSLRLNIVHVLERKPPRGEPAVEWFLLTNLPISNNDELAFIVDCYRARWGVEEYFKALKTGCQFEKRQLESAHSLLNALAILAPVAWRLLLLRHLARSKQAVPATAALTPQQLKVLGAVAKKPLPVRPSARDAMLAIAALGGHQKNNGDPGWLVLGRGMHDLLLIELGWRAKEMSPP